MQIGDLRKRVTIQAETETPDNAGGYVLGWSDVATVWAEIAPTTGAKVFTAQHLEGHVSHHVTLRYYAGITTDMRLLYNSRLFNIRAVLNTGEHNQWTELLVQEGAAL